MGNKSSLNIRNRVVTEFEYIQTLSPSKLAVYLRTILAHNQGCPPAPLIQVFSMCRDNSSCDDCWWTWLCSQHEIERQPKAAHKDKCWDCRWAVHGDTGRSVITCMNKRFYGIMMNADDYCSNFAERYFEEPEKSDVETAQRLGELREENREEVGAELRRRYELKQLAREQERRRIEKELLEEKNEREDDGSGDGATQVCGGEQSSGIPSDAASSGG